MSINASDLEVLTRLHAAQADALSRLQVGQAELAGEVKTLNAQVAGAVDLQRERQDTLAMQIKDIKNWQMWAIRLVVGTAVAGTLAAPVLL